MTDTVLWVVQWIAAFVVLAEVTGQVNRTIAVWRKSKVRSIRYMAALKALAYSYLGAASFVVVASPMLKEFNDVPFLVWWIQQHSGVSEVMLFAAVAVIFVSRWVVYIAVNQKFAKRHEKLQG